MFLRKVIAAGIVCLAICGASAGQGAEPFESAWPEDVERTWAGPEYWANRLQDWCIKEGRLECVRATTGTPVRTVHLLTRSLGPESGEFTLSVKSGPVKRPKKAGDKTWSGFLIGAGAGELDYRAAALVHHSAGQGGGILATMDATGLAVFRDMTKKGVPIIAVADEGSPAPPYEAMLRLTGKPDGDKYVLTLLVADPLTGMELSEATLEVSADKLVGGLALASHPGVKQADKTATRWWFEDWQVSGSKIVAHEDRNCGPILSAQHTLSRGVLKLTAQMMPLGAADVQTVSLETLRDGAWQVAATAEVIEPGYTAPFRVENWDSTTDTPYRVVYELKQADGSLKPYTWSGTIRRDPVDKPGIVVAGFTGNHNVRKGGIGGGRFNWNSSGMWFPHNDLVARVAVHKPDVLFFSGDQVYEGGSPTGADRANGHLDYLYKWYLWCWAFRDLAKDIPCICIPDDHDVYQGNVWGEGGRPAKKDNQGGYVMPAEFVKMVDRTQTSHLPDPFDPAPIGQGIGVYYTSMTYGRIGFAVIEDRKFKSGCAGRVPHDGPRPDHIDDPAFDPKDADVPGVSLLGDRQLRFLGDWAADWRGQDMKLALSQTVLANMATHHGRNLDPLAMDLDSNGWPQTGRNRALRELRRGFAFMLCGDQHLATLIQHGIDDWNDAGFSFCVPSIANFYPRAWNPGKPGANRPEGAPEHLGEHLDGLGNRVTVYGVTNPTKMTGQSTGVEPLELHDNMPGYGIVRFNKAERTITAECWPRYADADDAQYPGWPKTIAMEDNYSRKAAAYLPTLEVDGLTNPVVQVVNDADNETLYTLRIRGNTFRPKVFKPGTYTIRIGDPDAGTMKTLTGVKPLAPGEAQTVQVEF